MSGAPPDYLGVGCVGSANRWWHRLLLEHPQIRKRERAELSLGFFQQFCLREMSAQDVAGYHAHFAPGPGEIDGEWTNRYVFDPWTAPLLDRAAPGARLLVLLPDPVERYRRKLAVERPGVEDEHAGYWVADTAARGRYASQLRHLLEHVDRERVLVLQYERCRRDPDTEYARTLRFLGVDDRFRPPRGWDPDAPPLPTTAVGRARRTAGLARRRALGGAGAEPEPELPSLWPDLQAALREELGPEVEDLRALVPELDLELWPHYRELVA